jgi:hypothetical protein
MGRLFSARRVGGALLVATSLIWAAHAQEPVHPEGQFSGSQSDATSSRHTPSGKQLFTRSEFGGNGRTCETCHILETGDVTLDHIRTRFLDDPSDPLFRAIDSDDGSGASYDRLLPHATFRVFVDLPPNIRLADDPDATRVALFRSTLPTNNIALDPFIMWDGREPNLPHQALDAFVTTHSRGARTDRRLSGTSALFLTCGRPIRQGRTAAQPS